MLQTLTQTFTFGTHSTEIHFADGNFPSSVCSLIDSAQRSIIITDSNVWSHYEAIWNEVRSEISAVIVLPAGEEQKSLQTIERVAEQCIHKGIDRNSCLIALGGGVISDIVGFLAAIVFRGIHWIAVPTTIIGSVDAAIGGKTGVNLSAGKNLIGAFHPPEHVIVDAGYIRTLPNRELYCGWGEIYKYSLLIGDAMWTKVIESDISVPPTIDIVHECISKKIAVVNSDPYDRGERLYLNLGHTSGHALEAATGYNYFRHGEAVLWGLGVAIDLSLKLNLLPEPTWKTINEAIRKIPVPKAIVNPETIISYLSHDKKRSAGSNRWIMLEGIGKPIIQQDIGSEIITEVITSRITHLHKGRVA